MKVIFFVKKDCYENWYNVVIKVDYPEVQLLVNNTAAKNYLVANDYPLHRTSHGTKWTVGAAWEGNQIFTPASNIKSSLTNAIHILLDIKR